MPIILQLRGVTRSAPQESADCRSIEDGRTFAVSLALQVVSVENLFELPAERHCQQRLAESDALSHECETGSTNDRPACRQIRNESIFAHRAHNYITSHRGVFTNILGAVNVKRSR